MRYLALVTDYDNTLARDGRVADSMVATLRRLRDSGRRAILVTGRRLEDLFGVCQCIESFDYVVAENGAVAYDPGMRETTLLAEPPPGQFIEALRRRGVQPLEVGSVIVATHVPHEEATIETIRELGLELQVIFNREAVMVLPAGVNKASGMKFALRRLGMSPHEVVGVGDAENDHSFMRLSECPVAVANAIDSIKEMAAFVTRGEAGAGVAELIEDLVSTDLAQVDARLARHHIALGMRLDGTSAWMPPYGRNVLIAGPSGSGKSAFAAGLIERFAEQLYQVCVIDPEGDYVTLQTLATVGDQNSAPGLGVVLGLLRDPYVHVNIDLLGIPLADRPAYFAALLPHLEAMRVQTGRPHWLVVDEAHHLLPTVWGHVPTRLNETVLITVHPDRLAASVLAMIDVVIVVGAAPARTLRQFTAALGLPPVEISASHAAEGDVACWFVRGGQDPFPMRVIHSRAERTRHRRKYAEGDVRYYSFYFRGPAGKQNLRAQNLTIFCQLAEGIDEETWMYHLRRHDYSRWLRDVIKNEELAATVQDIEQRKDLSPDETRAWVRAAIEARYTLPE